MTWRWKLPSATILVVLLAYACGSGSPGDYTSAARDAAAASRLELSDLPAGWTQAPDGTTAEVPELALEGECAIFNQPNASGFEGAVATAGSLYFTGPDYQSAGSSATVFDGPESAATAEDTAVNLIDGCSDDIEAGARRLIEATLEDREIGGLFTDISVDFGETEFPTFAEATHAYRLEASVRALVTLYELTVDVIVLRDGPIVGVLTYLVEGEPDERDEETITRALAGKLSASAEDLAAN